jgi:hypothetical protein
MCSRTSCSVFLRIVCVCVCTLLGNYSVELIEGILNAN